MDMMEKAKLAICNDDWGCLVATITNKLEKDKSEGFASELLKLICIHRAVDCATGLLEGKTGIKVDLNAALDGGLSPLHLAAQNLCYKLVKLFMHHGALPNLCCDDDDAKLPLCLALEALSHNQFVTDWSAEKSVYKLIYIFCLGEMREALDTIKLLASQTEHLEKISIGYAKEGEVVKLAAILLPEWNMLMNAYKGVEESPIGQCIMKELLALSSGEEKSKLDLLHERKTKLESAWKMVKLLNLTHHRIEEYLDFGPGYYDRWWILIREVENHEVPFVVADFLGPKDSGLNLEDLFCDDIECLMPRLKPELKDDLYTALAGNHMQRLGVPAVHTFNTKMRTNTVSTFLLRRSFHTQTKPKFSKDIRGQLTTPGITRGENPSFSRRCIWTPRMFALLVSTAKRSLK